MVSSNRVPPQILFVSHDASATGAPNSLLNFLDWNIEHQKCRFRILLLDSGPLAGEFAKRGPTTIIRQSDTGLLYLLLRSWVKVRRALGLAPVSQSRWMPSHFEQRRVNACLAGFDADLIYINSIAAAPVCACLTRADVPVLTYLREMNEQVCEARIAGWLDTLVQRTTTFIAVSEAAKRNLMQQYGVKNELFTIISPFINTNKLQATPRTETRKALIERAGLKEADFIVAGCGTTNWRKGPGLFIAIARIFFEHLVHDRAVFIWIGGLHSREEQMQAAHDIRLAGLENRVTFIGEQLDAANLLSGADVLALTSREEPFSRVMLEAALGHCPVVCFEESGGAPEFVSQACGIAVPYLSLNAFASALLRLRQDDAFRATLGDSAYRRVIEHHDVQQGAERVFTLVESLL